MGTRGNWEQVHQPMLQNQFSRRRWIPTCKLTEDWRLSQRAAWVVRGGKTTYSPIAMAYLPKLYFSEVLGSVFGRTHFSQIFIFGAPDFSADFLARFFLLILWEKVPRKILQENHPRQNPPKIIRQKSPTHFCRGAGPRISEAKIYRYRGRSVINLN